MTSPMNEEPHQSTTDDRGSIRQAVIEDIHAYLMNGMPVYDRNGDKVGHVKMYSIPAGYLMVGCRAFEHDVLYIPFQLIRGIDPHDVFLTEIKDTVMSQYAEQPTVSAIVMRRLVCGPAGAMTAQTCEVQVVRSGYDGTPVALDCVDLNGIADRLAVGMVVYDVNGERLGDLTEYDASRGLMVVEKGIFKPKTLLVPLSAIEEIHPGCFTVYLSVPRPVAVKQYATSPVDTIVPADI